MKEFSIPVTLRTETVIGKKTGKPYPVTRIIFPDGSHVDVQDFGKTSTAYILQCLTLIENKKEV